MQMDEEVLKDDGPSPHSEPQFGEGMYGMKKMCNLHSADCYDDVSVHQCIPHMNRVREKNVPFWSVFSFC